MVRDRATISLQRQTYIKSYVNYRAATFSMTLTLYDPDFKVAPIFDAEYLSNGGRQRHIYN